MAILDSYAYNQPSPNKARWSRQERFLLWGALLFFAWVILKSAWLSDDAFITLRTVRNFVMGQGLVWNWGERVQAYTHPLWMLLLSLVYFVTGDAYYGTIFTALFVAIVTAVLVVWGVARSLTGAVVGLLLFSLSKAFVDYSTSGLENPLTHLLLALFAWLYWQQAPFTPRRLGMLALVTALALTNRMDSGLLLAPALLTALWQARSRKTGLMVVLGFLPLVLWESFSIFYYGFPFPNTAYAKLGTNISAGELIQQGLYYLLNSLVVDPITLLTIVLAIGYPLLRRQPRLWPWAVGILLYLAYVVQIGGDFMSGRFLSAPFCAAVLLLVQARYPPLWQPKTLALLAGVTVIGLLNPTQSSWLSNASYDISAIDSKGIADERGHYYQRYGLLVANRLNRLSLQNTVTGTREPADFIHCGIGVRGFEASPYTHLVDFCGLADALIARLPTVHDPNWRIGHPIRTVPLGYMGTLRTGQNQLADPDLALFYDKLRLITQGDLWNWARLGEIWNFNLGKYDQLIDAERYRYPEIVPLTLAGGAKSPFVVGSLFADEQYEIVLHTQGVRIDLTETRHATHLDLGLDCDYCEVVFFAADAEIARTLIRTAPLQLGAQLYSVVTVPPPAVAHGYDRIRITPLTGSTYVLTYLNLLDLHSLHDLSPTLVDLQALLRFYYTTFYRAVEPERAQRLAELRQQLRGLTDSALWQEIPLKVLLTLLAVPDPEIHPLIEPHLPVDLTLSDRAGRAVLRYLGVSGSETVEIKGKRYLQLRLHFLVTNALEQPYTAWFHMAAVEPADGEWMLYDYTPDPPLPQWQPGTLVEFAPLIELEPGQYKLSFGFWTPNVRQRLYVDQGRDVYWIELGEFGVE